MRTQRIDLIEKYIIDQKSVSLDELCEKFQVSKNTIRRDIDSLVKRNRIKKVYGGVTAVTQSSVSQLTAYEERSAQLPAAKDKICRMSAQFVENNDIIYIDTGTTCLHLVDYISDKTCTILTNSLQVCLKAVPYPNLTIISLPGRLKRETLSYVGNEIEYYLNTYNIGKAFMACSGVTIENGLTNASTEEYVVKKSVVENASHTLLLADHTKFGHFALLTYCPMNKIESIITDAPLSAEYQDYCNECGISVFDNE